jgi:hypothetical protein
MADFDEASHTTPDAIIISVTKGMMIRKRKVMVCIKASLGALSLMRKKSSFLEK